MALKKSVAVLIQARLNSQRLPEKIIKKINNKTIIQLIHERLSFCKEINDIIVVTTKDKKDDKLVKYLSKKKLKFFRGNNENCLNRYFYAAKKYNVQTVVRITGDCPLVDSKLVDEFIKVFKKRKVEYLSNTFPYSFPDGLDIEVFSFDFLKKAFKIDGKKKQLENVVIDYFRRNNKKIKFANITSKLKYNDIRLTLDHKADYKLINNIYNHFKPRVNFSWKDVMSYRKKNPEIFLINKQYGRNEGSQLSVGQKLWERAKEIIPGGNMLYSKNPDFILPKKWPSYFKKTRGYKIWGVDNKIYSDMSTMGVGTNILGYSNKEVDQAVQRVVKDGNLSSFNSPEEITLAEKLIEIHPWAEMVRFTRTGGEANSVAIRIARASTSKHNVAFCGYHGWHDWYLSSNLSRDKKLGFHLFPGVQIKGVPRQLKKTSIPFFYGDLNQLKQIIKKEKIGIIKMEVARSEKPNINFLKNVRKLCDKNNIILIFDECTTGFRENYGGLHKTLGVNPDIAIFGKTLGNGYAINAIIGKKKFMSNVTSTFISSTFWGERIGYVAALKTLDVMKKKKSWKKINYLGRKIIKKLKSLSKANNIKMNISEMPSIIKFNFISKNDRNYKTLITQEMLKKNILATSSIYISCAHDEKILKKYFDILKKIFLIIKKCEKGHDINNYLDVPTAKKFFKRLN